jgi:hypothetical protein
MLAVVPIQANADSMTFCQGILTVQPPSSKV